jgi:hypothetical protein
MPYARPASRSERRRTPGAGDWRAAGFERGAPPVFTRVVSVSREAPGPRGDAVGVRRKRDSRLSAGGDGFPTVGIPLELFALRLPLAGAEVLRQSG